MNRRILNNSVISWLAVTLFLSAQAWAASPPKLVAASYSDRYHLSTCKIAQQISADDLIVFNTPEEAWEAGLVPCKKCNPPVPKGKEPAGHLNFSSRSKGAGDSDT